jgi:hypothetical protein
MAGRPPDAEPVDDTLQLRRFLYEQAAASRRGRRRMLRRQIQVLTGASARGGDDGLGPVREPRRPRPSTGPASHRADLPGTH